LLKRNNIGWLEVECNTGLQRSEREAEKEEEEHRYLKQCIVNLQVREEGRCRGI
jgi:hypothetical protein